MADRAGSSSSTVSVDAPVRLARHLGLFEATMIGVGAMIGAGIFVLTGIASGKAGPAALIAFGLNGVVTLFTALSYAELSSAIPEAGGGYSFVKKVMPNPVAFASGWMLWFAYVVACSLYAKGFGSYFLEFAERRLPGVAHALVESVGRGASVALLTVAVGILFLAVNIVGAHASGQTENVITLGKIAILSVFIGFGLWRIGGDPTTTGSNFTPLFPNGFSGVLAALGLTFIAFEGYDLIATVSEEVKEPERTIPRAILYSLGITMAIYLLVVFVCLGAVPAEGGVPTWRMLGDYGEIGIIRAAQGFMPSWGVLVVLIGGLFATLSALNATVLASSRVAFSMGRDWMLPNTMSRLHSGRKTPVMAITISGLLFLVVAVFLPLETIGTASSLLFLLTFSLVNVSLLIYRRRSTGEPPPFRVPLYPLTPLLGVGTCLGLAIFQLANEPTAWLLAITWVVVGLIVYAVLFARRATVADVPRVIESPELLELKRAARYKILVPVSNPERVESLISLAGAVAEASQGEVVALKVVELPDITAYADAEDFIDGAQAVLRRAQERAIGRAFRFSSLLKVGRSSAEEIVDVAAENGCDLILMGYKLDKDPLENSVIHHVVARQPCDVAILKSDGPGGDSFREVLVPIGGREIHDRLKVRLVHSLHQRAQREGDATAAGLTLLTVVPPDAGSLQRRRAQDNLSRAARIFQIPEAELVVDEGDEPADAIVARARAHDLVVMGMKEEPWFRSFFFGTLTQQVAAQAGCPTLLVKARLQRRSWTKRLLGLDAASAEGVEETRSSSS